MHTLKGAFPEVQVSGGPVPHVLFILPDLRTCGGWRSLPRLLNGKSRVQGEELLSHSSLLPYTLWKEREGTSKGWGGEKNPSHKTTITQQPKSEVVNLLVHKAVAALRGDKKAPKAVARGQNTMRQPSTVPCGHPTQQQGCSPRPPAQGLPLLGERENGTCRISLGNNHSQALLSPTPFHILLHPDRQVYTLCGFALFPHWVGLSKRNSGKKT